jgi:prevent-host-death family protein
MDPLPDVVPISELRTRQNELLEGVSQEPILLTQHGRAVAVLLGPEPYNRLLEQLEDLQLALDAVEARSEAAMATDFEEYLEERGEHVPAAPDK